MSKFNVSSSLKNNYVLLFILTSLLNGILFIIFTSGINNFRFIISDFIFLLFICILSKLFKNKKRYFLIVSFILSLICCINSLYYNNYMDYSSFNLLTIINQLFGMPSGAVTSLFKFKNFVFFLQFIILLIFYKKFKVKINYKKCLELYFVSILLIALTLTSNDIYRLKHNWNRVYVVNNFGIYNYEILDVLDIVNVFKKINYKNDINDIDQFYKNRNLIENEYTNIFKGKSVLFIHAESVQSMFLFNKINDQVITPNLNKLALSGLYFSNYYSLEGVGTSSDSEFTINTSVLPNIVKPAFVNYENNTYNTLLKEFNSNGYYTFSMHANKCTYWNRAAMYKSLGYNRFYCGDDYIKDEIIGMGLSDKSFFKQSITKINDISKEHNNYYGTLIALTNHTPFVSDINFDVGYMENTKIGNYLKTLHYFDEALGEFINNVDLNNTVIVLYGDHDAKFTKEEYEFYLNKKIDFYEYEKLTRVPLIIWSKDLEYKEISIPIGSIDIAPTLANMFGIKNKYFLGNDIFSVDDNIVVFPNGNWLTNKVYCNNRIGDVKMYDNVSMDYINSKESLARERIEISNKIIRNNYFK